jgi:hypothetical protein
VNEIRERFAKLLPGVASGSRERETNMEAFIGKVSFGPERRDDRWHFSLYNEETGEEINCMSSRLFETENPNIKLNLKPREVVRVAGVRQYPGQFWFDRLYTDETSK